MQEEERIINTIMLIYLHWPISGVYAVNAFREEHTAARYVIDRINYYIVNGCLPPVETKKKTPKKGPFVDYGLEAPRAVWISQAGDYTYGVPVAVPATRAPSQPETQALEAIKAFLAKCNPTIDSAN